MTTLEPLLITEYRDFAIPPGGRETGHLAQEIQNQALQILRNARQTKVKEASQSLDQLVRITELIKDLKIESPILDLRLKEVRGITTKYNKHMEKTRSACLSTVWRRFGRDRQLSPILLELKGAVEMLEMNQDFQCSRKLRDLKKKVSPSRGAYSNADLAKFFQGNIEGWKSATKSVDISTKCAIVGVIIELEAGGSIRVEIYLETDFEAACNELGNHLLSCSTSIEGIFHESTSDLGTIRLDTNAKDPAPLILWVCHNVFVRAELRPLDSESSGADSPDRFHRLMKKMFQYILDGCLPERQDLTQPEILKSSMKDFAYVGETFDVCIATDPDRFCKVECDDNKLLYVDYEIKDSRYTFTFSTMEEGDATVHFHFADPNTFNFTSVDFKIQVKSPHEKIGSVMTP